MEKHHPDNHRLLAAIFERLPEVVAVLDSGGLVRFASGGVSTVLGHSPADFIGKAFSSYLPEEEAGWFDAALRQIGEGASAWGPGFHSFKHGSGTWVQVETTVIRLDAEGEDGSLIVYSRRGRAIQAGEDALRRMGDAIEQIDEAVIITDRSGVIEYVNNAFERMTGYPKGEVLGGNPRILKSGKHGSDLYQQLWETILSGRSFHGIMVNQRKDGSIYYEEKTITPLSDADGEVTHFISTGVDITRRGQAMERLLAGAERFTHSLQGANDGLWDWDFRKGTLQLSHRWKSMLGYENDEVGEVVEDWFSLIHPDDLPEFKTQLRAHLEGGTPHFEHEHRIRHKDGGYSWVLTRGLAVRDEAGKSYRIAGSQSDITGRKVVEQKLQHDALHDSLTGLPNRTLFLDRLRQALARAKRHEKFRFAVLFLDLDRFKIVNDSLGHLEGDRLLVEVTRRIKEGLRSSDTAARLGGDEFAILLEDLGSDLEATAYAERLQKEISRPCPLGDRDVFTSASIGISFGDRSYEHPEDVLRDADAAMYHAKSQGRARHTVFDSTMHSRALEQLEMETDLRRAVERGGLMVRYQPIVSLRAGRIAGFEALLRWFHPKRGSIPTSQFIPMAEETGLINTIGHFVLAEACQRIKAWQRKFPTKPPLTMSVNLSGVQFMRPDLLNRIDLILREYGLDPRCLKLEITESTIIEHAEYAAQMIAQFKANHIQLSIDDFGTGYSSMSNLRRYPIDTVKIDQTFIRRICEDRETMEIVKTTITMAHNLKMDVVAEGVETESEMDLLRSLSCDYAQGFLFAEALDTDVAEALLAAGKAWQGFPCPEREIPFGTRKSCRALRARISL